MARLTDEEREHRRLMKAAAALERAPRGLSVVSEDEERRLYELARAGIDAPISVPLPLSQETGTIGGSA